MAGKRRGGFRPPELRGTLGTLLNTALQQAGVVRDALERGAREGRSKLDEVRSGRRRQDALAELGEIVLDLIRRGEIDTAELPEAEEIVRFLDELDAEDDQGRSARGRERGDVALPPTRRRFDERAATDDGTVASGKWAPPRRPGRDTTVWRPPIDGVPTPAEAAEAAEPAEVPRRGNLPRDPNRKGGIAFEDDDLADYMHPDDVPPKEPPGGDS